MLPIDLHMQKKLAGKGGFLIPFLCKKKGENFLSEVRLEHLIPDNASLSNITKIRIARNFSLVHISPIWLYPFYIFVDNFQLGNFRAHYRSNDVECLGPVKLQPRI